MLSFAQQEGRRGWAYLVGVLVAGVVPEEDSDEVLAKEPTALDPSTWRRAAAATAAAAEVAQ